jgi:hypothetical protein
MNKVVDHRLIEAARLGQQQETAGSTSRMIKLQETREKLVTDVQADVAKLVPLCQPWTYVAPEVDPTG